MSDKLRNCPFCGSAAYFHYDGTSWNINCNGGADCATRCSIGMREKSDVIAAWNQRTDPVKAQLIEALKNLISMLEATEACLYSWNKSGSPVNTERGIAQASAALVAAEAE